MLVRVTTSVESQRHICYLSLLVALSFCLLFPHTQFPDGHNSKVMDALERVASYHTSMVQRSSQVRWDAVGSACWCSHVSGKTRAWQSNLLACHCCWLLATLFTRIFIKTTGFTPLTQVAFTSQQCQGAQKCKALPSFLQLHFLQITLVIGTFVFFQEITC